MHDANQGLDFDPEFSRADDPPRRPTLWPWLVIVGVAGIGAVMIGQAELAVLAVCGGLFALAHASDLDPEQGRAYGLLAWVVPAGAVMAFASLAILIAQSELPPTQRAIGLIGAGAGVAFSIAAGWRRVAHELARTLFGVDATSRVLRLAARLAVVGTLFSVPASLAFPAAIEQIERAGTSLVGGTAGLWGNLAGLVILALGGVGFLVRRDARSTLERLGLGPLKPADAIGIALGVAALVGLNMGAEWIQKTWLPDLWANDQRVTRLIAGGLSRPEALVLGLSAGFGEEIALRGALQPRLGVFRTSMLFALLHVQYSWFGMLIIALLGLVLGWIRQRSSTSVAIAVHSIYDVVAVLTLE